MLRGKPFKGDPDPDVLAACALGGLDLCPTRNGRIKDLKIFPEGSRPEDVLHIVQAAGIRFHYLWDICHVDAVSVRRASLLIMLSTMVIVAYGVSPTFDDYHTGSRLTGSECLYLTLFAQTTKLAIGLCFSAGLYLMHSFLERKLARRKICWSYFCSRLSIELSRE
jgi:hypothetical protein